MKNILIAIVTSLFLFGLSAGTSFYINRPIEIAETESDSQVEVADPEKPFANPPVKQMEPQLPVALRPDQALTIDAVQQMASAAERRQQQLEEFEKQIKKEEQRVQLLFEDLKREKKELTTYAEGIEGKIRALDEMTLKLQELSAKIVADKKELESLSKNAGVGAEQADQLQAKVDSIKSWFEDLEPAQAADIILVMANDGDLELAASTLDSLQGRQKAKILQAIDDASLVNQLIDSLATRKKGRK